jgi:hypothetical protein
MDFTVRDPDVADVPDPAALHVATFNETHAPRGGGPGEALRLQHGSDALAAVRGVGRLLRCLTLATLAACGSGSRAATPAPVAHVVQRTWSAVDAELAAKRLGRLVVVVRSTDFPMQAVGQAQLTLTSTAMTRDRTGIADAAGIAELDSLPAGTYAVEVRRIGYVMGRVHVAVEPGCRSILEVYLGMAAFGLNPPAPMPTRSTATLCRQ